MNKPTPQVYEALQHVYDTFNDKLFDGKLDNSLITLQRKANTFGYMSYNRFISIDDKNQFAHELALNPEFFGVKPLIELFQTICHEMVHLYQVSFGKPSQKGYHNQEFATMMKERGLRASSTGRPGGKETGQHMADYPIPGGKFLEVSNDLFNDGIIVAWYDRYMPKRTSIHSMLEDQQIATDLTQGISESLLIIPHLPTEIDLNSGLDNNPLGAPEPVIQFINRPLKSPKSKYKFTCPKCKNNLWGKESLNVVCADCSVSFELQIDEYEE